MLGKNIMVSTTDAESIGAVAATRANVVDFEIELGERESLHTEWPKITLVTAVYNGAKYLEATIRSVVEQAYPNLEYIVVDDGSTDGTGEIIRKYERAVSCWIRQENQGLYAALNAGFARSTGEVMGWLNSSDLLQVNGLFTVGSVFAGLREVEWITGRPTKISATGMTIDVLRVPRWSRGRFLAGANKHIQQESTFWRRSLWGKAGGYLDTDYRAEGDFALWVRFFRHARLHSVNALIGGYRLHEGALSAGNMERYNRNCDEIAGREVESLRGSERAALRAFRWISDAVKPIPKVRGLWQRAAMQNLYWMRGRDWPEVIEYGDRGWELRK
jgi:glycosyltransferase involved in cell wall biosynthesis